MGNNNSSTMSNMSNMSNNTNTKKYSCDTSTANCFLDPNGPHTDLLSCSYECTNTNTWDITIHTVDPQGIHDFYIDITVDVYNNIGKHISRATIKSLQKQLIQIPTDGKIIIKPISKKSRSTLTVLYSTVVGVHKRLDIWGKIVNKRIKIESHYS